MNHKYFADIEWSKKLAHHFQDAEWWWVFMKYRKAWLPTEIMNTSTREERYPAIHTDMVLEKLPHQIRNPKNGNLAQLGIGRNSYDEYICEYHTAFDTPMKIIFDKKLPNALCAMLEWLEKEGLLNGNKKDKLV